MSATIPNHKAAEKGDVLLVRRSAGLDRLLKGNVSLLRRECRALALRKTQQIQGALAPGLPFNGHNMPFPAASHSGTRLFLCVISGTLPLDSTVTLPPFQSTPAGTASDT